VSTAYWIFLLILVATDILFSLMRISLINARLPHLFTLREGKPNPVDRTLQLLEKPHLPATVRLASLLNHFLLAGVALLLLMEYTGPQVDLWPILLVILVLTIIVLIIEFALEGAVSPHAEKWAVALTPVAGLVDFILRPITWLLMLLLGPATLQRPRMNVTEDELKNWVEDEQNESSLEQGERRMIYSIFQFGDTLCREIMVPRIDVFALDVNTSVPEAIEGALRSGHSRLPVYEEAIDNVIGVLYAKDLLRLSLSGDNGNSIRALVRPAYFVPEAKKVDELLRELQARGVHIAIVVDEYGGMAGVVTLEDIVEEIVGDIRDEFDESEELIYQQVSPNEYLFLGRIDLDDLNEMLGTHFTKEIADTLGGYIYGQIGRVPVGGETLQVEDWEITVEQVSGRRIRLVRAIRRMVDRETEEKQNEPER
jgi:putative hemolysin